MSSRPSAINPPRSRNRFATGRSTPFTGARPPRKGNGFNITKTMFFGKKAVPPKLTAAQKALRAGRKARKTNLAVRQKKGFSTFSGGRSIFGEPGDLAGAPKSSARSVAAKARAPLKGSPAAMAIGARLRAAKANKGNVGSFFA